MELAIDEWTMMLINKMKWNHRLKMKTPHLPLHHPLPKVQLPPAGCPLLPEWPEVASVWL